MCLCNGRRRVISSWVIRYSSGNKGIVWKPTYAENDPTVRSARVRSSSSGSFPVSCESPSQSLSTISSPPRSSTAIFRPLKYFTTGDTQRFGIPKEELPRTFFHLLRLVIHDRARKVNWFQQVTRFGVPGPIYPVKKHPLSDRLNDRCFYGRPVGGVWNGCGLLE